MEINKEYRSPNHSSRKGTAVDTIVIHHTGGNSIKSTLKWFQDSDSKVSAHYVIDLNGTIYQMVDESKNAWHAGVSWLPSEYGGDVKSNSVNERSIGIELVNKGDGKTPFLSVQVASCKWLVDNIRSRYSIPWENVLGHKEVAPGRKTDPAENFPWNDIKP